jgi:uncharacterized membrane protein
VSSNGGAWSDQQVEARLGRLLQVGILLAAFVVLAGGVLYLIRYGAQRPEYGLFRGEPDDLRSVGGIVRGALHIRRSAIIQFGVLLLIATPIARVVFSAYAFARQRDYFYVAVTGVVLAVLLFSLFWGRA